MDARARSPPYGLEHFDEFVLPHGQVFGGGVARQSQGADVEGRADGDARLRRPSAALSRLF
jgi:hypothetical protein